MKNNDCGKSFVGRTNTSAFKSFEFVELLKSFFLHFESDLEMIFGSSISIIINSLFLGISLSKVQVNIFLVCQGTPFKLKLWIEN